MFIDKYLYLITSLKSRGFFLTIQRLYRREFYKLRNIPYNIQIESSNYCNLNCPYCSASRDIAIEKKGNLSPVNFKKIIDDVTSKKKYYPTITLYNRGEPLINISLSEMIKYAKSKNLEVTISTNGTLFVDKKVREKILNSGVYLIIISIDGLNKETYEKNRSGARFDEVVKGIKCLIKEREQLNLKHDRPFIEIQYIVTKETEKDLVFLGKFKNELGVDNVRLKTFKVQQINRNKGEILKHALEFLPEDKKFNRYVIKDGELIVKENSKKCEWGYNCVVLHNGDMVSCCEDFDGRYCYGNVTKDYFWTVYSRKELRAKVLNKKLPICKFCS